jgi:hypothetical protein
MTGAEAVGLQIKASNPNIQTPGNLQSSSSKIRVAAFGHSNLEFLWSLVLGIWSFWCGEIFREKIVTA